MSDDLLRLFQEEHEALLRQAVEFATAHPGAAEALRLGRGRVDDPHVERLLEGVAFLGARVRERLDDEFPELTDALLGVLYPHYLAPFPSCMMMQVQPGKELRGPAVLPRDTLVLSDPIDGTACRFATTAPVTLWPIEIEDASLTGLPLPNLPVRLPRRAAGVLRLTLRCRPSAPDFEALGLDTLRLHLSGARQTALALCELLGAHVIAVALADGVSDERPVLRPADAIQAGGFGADEAMLPWPAQGFAGFRLLSEYFAFPDKFLFVDIGGIGGKCDAGLGRRLDIFVYLDDVPAQLERAVDKTCFALGCVPLINLFPHRCEPIDLDWSRSEFQVHPDLRRPRSLEVWSITRVQETRLDGSERPWRPFFRTGHADTGPVGGSYRPVRRAAQGGASGSDVFLAVDDPAYAAERTGRQRLSVDALCTNRDLPRRLSWSLPKGDGDEGQPRLRLDAGGAVAGGVVALSPVTEALPPPPRAQRFWRLISHLSLSHLSVVGGGEGAAMLREVLRLYDLRDTAATKGMIEALIAVSAAPGTARLPDARLGSFCRGVDVRLTFEPQAWQGAGLYLLGSVLARFLALHGTVNSFVRTTALLQGRPDPVARWPARSGARALL